MRVITFTLVHDLYGPFTDAVTVSDGATPAQIEAEQQLRLANWVDSIEHPRPTPPQEQVDG